MSPSRLWFIVIVLGQKLATGSLIYYSKLLINCLRGHKDSANGIMNFSLDVSQIFRYSSIKSRVILMLGLLFAIFFRSVIAAGPSRCFNMDGTYNADRQPCIPSDSRASSQHSACCNLDDPLSNDYDICTHEGVCFIQGSSDNRGLLYQDGCTDSSLEDSTCRSHCAPSLGGELPRAGPFLHLPTTCKGVILSWRLTLKTLTNPVQENKQHTSGSFRVLTANIAVVVQITRIWRTQAAATTTAPSLSHCNR